MKLSTLICSIALLGAGGLTIIPSEVNAHNGSGSKWGEEYACRGKHKKMKGGHRHINLTSQGKSSCGKRNFF